MSLPLGRAAVAVLLTALLAGAVNPAPRDPDLDMGRAVTALAMGSTSAWVAAGTTDPGGPADMVADDTWNVWDGDGDLQRTDDANGDNCNALNPCSADVTDIALSASGTRIAIASRDQNQEQGRVVFFTTGQGRVSIQPFDEMPNAIAFTDDGQALAVGTSVPEPVNEPDSGAVHLYTWGAGSGSNPGSVSRLWRTVTSEAVTEVAIGANNRISAAAGSEHYRFGGGTGAAFIDNLDSPAVSVAFSRSSSSHWSVAGQADGGILLYSDDSDSSPFSPALDLRPGTASTNAVAIASDGSFFVTGDNAGRLRLYDNPYVGTGGTTLVATSPALDGPVRDIALSNDGRYLAVAAGQSAYLFRVGVDRLDQTWVDDLGADAVHAAVSADGGTVAVSHGTRITVYEATPAAAALDVDAPTSVSGQAGQEEPVLVTYRNAGNREVTATLEATLPSGWIGAPHPASFTLQPEQEAEVYLNVTPPSSTGAASYEVRLAHRVGGIPTTTVIPFHVGQFHLWTVETDGALTHDIDPGGSTEFELTVTNHGNGADATEIGLELDDEAWTAEVEPATLQLDAGQNATVVLTLQAPAEAAELDAVEVQVLLTADEEAGITVGAVVGARFGVDLSLASSGPIEVDAGDEADLVLRVKNLGNAADAFDLDTDALPSGWEVSFPEAAPYRVESVQAGATQEAEATLTVPEDAEEGNYQITFRATSLGDEGEDDTATLVVHVPEPDGDGKGKDKGGPGPEAGLMALALLGAAAWLMRRSR